MRIGVIADTHGYFDPRLRELLAGVEVILHAGDVGTQAVLDELGQIAPVRAVRGNVDPPELNLPLSLKLDIEGLKVEMMHILPVPQSEVEDWADRTLEIGGKPPRRSEAFLKTFDDAIGVVVFGHSHQPCLITLGRRLFFNPGSAGKKRFDLPRCCGLLEVVPSHAAASTGGRLETLPAGIASILPLEKHRESLPHRVQLDFEE
ncbi:MAG TPA: metallophosphoesterase family protein [Terriglobia bacterium]|nr:metallophosphoesterase family protein [Terriglobia bacterium]